VRYETLEDRRRQEIMKGHLHRFLVEINGWPITIKETPWSKAESHDYEFVVNDGLIMGVTEIKCRQNDYDEKFFRRRGWLIENRRIESLRSAWSSIGAFVMFGLLTADEEPYVISMQKLEVNLHKLKRAGSWMLKDDHGRRPTNKTGMIVPLNMMTYIGERQ